MAISSLFMVQAHTLQAQPEVKRSVTKIAEGIYRLQNNHHYSMVVITGEGAVITDPINADAAKWIKSEVAKLTKNPITHLIYSHSHDDHASGGAVLAEKATVITQANAPASIDGVTPTLRFDQAHTFSLGSKTFELTWLGPGHGEDLIAVVVRPDNVGFITDVVVPKRLPWKNFGGSNIDNWVAQIKKVEALDFDIFAPAHGNMGVKADTVDVRNYIEKLKSSVLAGLNAGKTVDEIKKDVTMDEYKDWIQYNNWLAPNIEGMADFLVSSGQVSH